MRFGPFLLDQRTWTLARDGTVLDLSPRLVEILAFLATRHGEIVTKDELLDRFWPDVNVTDNTLTRAIADIRKAMGDDAAAPTFLQTASRRGYRFIGALSAGEVAAQVAETPLALHDTEDDVFALWVKGRLALESLDVARLESAIGAFERAAVELPRYAPAHAGLANAYLLDIEASRAGGPPDRERLARAIDCARKASALDPGLGEGWAVLGHLLVLAGRAEDAKAAALRATAVEPDNWRHQYRLALATWGEERLRAVDRSLTLMPAFAPAHLLSAMVFVARGALDRAAHDIELGVERLPVHGAQATLPGVGVHWMRGLIAWARGRYELAFDCFEAERRAATAGGHVYARECIINALLGAGFARLATGELDSATTAFSSVLDTTPEHPKALIGLSAVVYRAGRTSPDDLRSRVRQVLVKLESSGLNGDVALLQAGDAALSGRLTDAMTRLQRLVGDAPPGRTGWMIPIDPMFAALHDQPAWDALLGSLAGRAA